jgi:L-ascorbate metabolism protein UlaG (beta-lactamase superfamily)
MEIDWFGHSCFRLHSRAATVVTDPYDKSIGLENPRPRADVVTISHDHPGHSNEKGARGDAHIVRGPGEYEVRDVFITGVQSFHDKKKGKERGKNTIYVIEMDDLRVAHVGDLGYVPSQSDAEGLGNVDILLVPVGGVSTINASEATELVSLLEPAIVIPMHYRVPDLAFKLDTVDKFIKEMGVKAPKPVESLKVTKETLPKETQLVLLEMKQKEKED